MEKTTLTRTIFKRILCLLLLLPAGGYLIAQGTLTGKVIDNENNPLIGASVVLVGTGSGTVTDIDGNYVLELPVGTQTIRISYTGYTSETLEIAVENGRSYQQDFKLSQDQLALDEVVVTATFGSRSQKEAPLSMTYLNANQIQKLSANSQADILRTIPGITAEGGGGEVAANIFVRGMPSGGQYQFTPLQVDGVPVLSTFGLNSSAHDVYFRNDIGIKSLEFARGGASTLFGAGSVAGIINYSSITGGPEFNNKIQLEVAGGGRAKVDFLSSGPLAENTYYAFSGFYRYDNGPLQTGLPTRGYQFRGNIKKLFNNGNSSVTLYGQLIDDNAQFYLPFPLANANGEKERPTGNDGETIYTMLTNQATDFAFNTPNGRYKTSIGDGVSTKGGYLMVDLKHNFGNNWKVSSKVKSARYDHWFNLFLDGDGTRNTPESQSSYLADRGLPAGGEFTFTDTGARLGSTDLVYENRILDRERPMQEMVGELNLTKTVNGHNITLGTFLSNTKAEDNNWLWRFLGDFSNSPRAVGLTYVNAQGSTVSHSTQGFISGSQTSNILIESVKSAVYIADEYKGEKFNFDIGARWEKASGNISRETVIGANTFQKGSVSTDGLAVAVAGLYKINKATSVYANASKGYFFPELRSVKFSSPGKTQSYEPEDVIQAELGTKYNSGKFAATGALFLVALGDRRSVDFVNNSQGGVVEEVSVQSTRTIGLEANLNYQLASGIQVYGNATYQKAEFTKFEGNEALVGKEPRRQPTFMGMIGVSLTKGNFDVDISNNFMGNKFANDANTVELEGYSIARLSAGYKIDLGSAENLYLGISIFNLFDSAGVTEGSPRQGNAQVSGGEFFVGRPELPRRIFFRAAFDF